MKNYYVVSVVIILIGSMILSSILKSAKQEGSLPIRMDNKLIQDKIETIDGLTRELSRLKSKVDKVLNPEKYYTNYLKPVSLSVNILSPKINFEGDVIFDTTYVRVTIPQFKKMIKAVIKEKERRRQEESLELEDLIGGNR